ncbi:hypothetical protein LINPERHAP1_LOCUS13771, partial [Linum perenne]
MKRAKYLPPGNLRRDAKKPRSFRMLCSDSNPTTDHDVPFVSSRDASITRCYFRPIDVLYEQFCLMVVILTVHYCRREDQEIEKRKGSRGRGPEEGVQRKVYLAIVDEFNLCLKGSRGTSCSCYLAFKLTFERT